MDYSDAKKNPWLIKARDAYNQSTDFVDRNYRNQWSENLAHFQSRHAPRSKYLTAAYQYRSTIFRPKTRASIRANESAVVSAFFSNRDVVDIAPQNEASESQKIISGIISELVNLRLTKSIPWFQVLVGAYQETMVHGVVISKQYWDYSEPEASAEEDVLNFLASDAQAQPLADTPKIELIPIENFRIHPSADWHDPINSSPYLIRLIPMYVLDVKTHPSWKKVDDKAISAAMSQSYDLTREDRESPRDDRYDVGGTPETLSDYDVVWVHENIMRDEDGEDYVFHTLGTELLLEDPAPLKDVYLHGIRPYVMGCCTMETHKLYPSGIVEMAANIQKEINEVANQRLDNVKLVLNKRWLAKRGSEIDFRSITRNVPGSITLLDEMGDVLPVEFSDVTASSYQEQDRLNVDFDELVGAFSSSTIQTNRKLNETVGGMAMLRGSSNALMEYSIRVFSETWVEPVLRQLIKLECAYETDETILGIAADRAKVWPEFKQIAIRNLKADEVALSVNVGMGATDPQMRVRTFMEGLMAVSSFLSSTPPGIIKVDSVVEELFSRMGYKDGARFVIPPEERQDPEKQQMAQQIQQLAMELEAAKRGDQVKVATVQMQEEGDTARTLMNIQAELEQLKMKLGADMQKAWMDNRTKRQGKVIDAVGKMEKQRKTADERQNR